MFVEIPPERIVNKTVHSKVGLESLKIDCSCDYSVGKEQFSLSPTSTVVTIKSDDPHPVINHAKDVFTEG